MKRVFIAGATGCLGRHLCAEYQRQGWYVIALVSTSNQVEPIAADQLVEADATDAATLKGAMAGADLVVSCLGALRLPDGQDDWTLHFRANLNLLREAERAGVGRFAYVPVLGTHEQSRVPIEAARSAFEAELQRSAIETKVITHQKSSGMSDLGPSALAFDMFGTCRQKDHFGNELAPTQTASIHPISTERKQS